MNQTTESPQPRSTRRRVAAVVGLTLLEVIRRQDLPKEILEAEDPSITMPRRLGLSDVIDRQIRIYREEVRKGGRMADEELRDLIRLVIRRPDSTEVFFRAGRVLSGEDEAVEGWQRFLPEGLSFGLARRAVGRRLRKLFGRRFVTFEPGPFTMEARSHVLMESDPGGDACHLVTGLAEAVVQRYASPGHRIAHDKCESRKDHCCRWTVLQEEPIQEPERVGDLLLHPEPGAG